jgi:6-phosphogluconolactonase
MTDVFVSSLPVVIDHLVASVRDAAAAAMAARGQFTIALPGGSVATEGFPRLAMLPLDWSHVHFFWADERAVPASDPESNFGLAERLWLTPAGVPQASIHRMPADAVDLDRGAAEYDTELAGVLRAADGRLDLVVLGMGPDGHIASLFPGHPLLRENARRVAAVTDASKPPPRRLTLTMPVIAAARRVIVAAFGESKADALADAVRHEGSALPVAHLLRRAKDALILADEAAGAKLKADS